MRKKLLLKRIPEKNTKPTTSVQFILLSVNFLQEDQVDGAISPSLVRGRLCPRPFLGGGAILLAERNSWITQSQSSQKWPSLPASVYWKLPFLKAYLNAVAPTLPSLRPPSESMDYLHLFHLTLDFCSSHALEGLVLISSTSSQSLAQNR